MSTIKANQLAVGSDFACALLQDVSKSVVCWGNVENGSLGREFGGPPFTTKPLRFIGSSATNPVIKIAAGDFHACAILADGTLHCWGKNNQGQLGLGDLSNRGIPVIVKLEDGNPLLVRDISLGAQHTCAVILSDGSLTCFGDSSFGQLGLPVRPGPDHSVKFPGNSSESLVFPKNLQISQLSAGGFYTCVVLNDQTVRCFGRNSDGELGDSTFDSRFSVGEALKFMDGSLLKVSSISTGRFTTCVILPSDNSIRCFGRNDQLQAGTTRFFQQADKNFPVKFRGDTVFRAKTISVGGFHTCFTLLDDNTVFCTGDESKGQLGYGASDPNISEIPFQLPRSVGVAFAPQPGDFINLGDSIKAKRVVSGSDFTCVILEESNSVRCWGNNKNSQCLAREEGIPEINSPPIDEELQGIVNSIQFSYSPTPSPTSAPTQSPTTSNTVLTGEGNTDNTTTAIVLGILIPLLIILIAAASYYWYLKRQEKTIETLLKEKANSASLPPMDQAHSPPLDQIEGNEETKKSVAIV